MKLVKIVLFLSLFVVMACSCSSGVPPRSDSGVLSVDAWLESKMTAEPTVDLTGKWDAGSAFAGGWGEGNFIQEKARFSGTLGMYYLKGVVSGGDLHFALTSNGVVYYTGVMSQSGDDSFSGKAVKEVFADSEAAKTAETYPIAFQKMN